MIINLRGTHGSGKSTVARRLLDSYPHEVIGSERKPEGYEVRAAGMRKPVYVVGSYKTACGGCDGIQPFDLIFPRAEDYAGRGHVLFEGAVVSTSGYGRVERCVRLWGDRFVAAFLDTPLEVCLDRIRRRREARGNAKPLDPSNTESKWNSVLKSRDKIGALGARVVVLDHRRAYEQVLALYRAGDRRE